MPSAGRNFSGSAQLTSLFHPWITPPWWQDAGTFLGFELRTGRPVLFDPQMLKRDGIINTVVLLLMAIKDHGKSTLAKSLAMRLMTLQSRPLPGLPEMEARGRIHDRKSNKGRGEYADVVDWLEADNFALGQMASLNIFDPKMNMTPQRMITVTVDFFEMMLGRRLQGLEFHSIQVAVYNMVKHNPRFSSTLFLQQHLLRASQGDLREFEHDFVESSTGRFSVATQNDEDFQINLAALRSQSSNIMLQDMRRDTGVMSSLAAQLMAGNYGTMFNGDGSMYDALTNPMAGFDWTGVEGATGAMLEYLITMWKNVGRINKQYELIPTIELRDELGSKLKNILAARARDEEVRISRADSITDIMITQYPTDLTQLGEDGSELRNLGQSINRGVGMRFIGRMTDDDDTMHELHKLGMSDEDAWITTTLPQGCWAVVIPDQKTRWIQHMLLEPEIKLIGTNSANEEETTRRNVFDFPFVRERMQIIEGLAEAMRLEPVQLGKELDHV